MGRVGKPPDHQAEVAVFVQLHVLWQGEGEGDLLAGGNCLLGYLGQLSVAAAGLVTDSGPKLGLLERLFAGIADPDHQGGHIARDLFRLLDQRRLRRAAKDRELEGDRLAMGLRQA